jgi:hypothetical protein
VIGFGSPERFDAWICRQADQLNLREGFISSVRRAHGFVPPTVPPLAEKWAQTVSAALFFRVAAHLDPQWRPMLGQLAERAQLLRQDISREMRTGLAQ